MSELDSVCQSGNEYSPNGTLYQKMRQAGCFTFLTVRWWRLVAQLQRKLDVSRRLQDANNSSCGYIYGRARNGEVDGIKCIQEVRAELELKSLCDPEVFLEADIPVVVSGSAQLTELVCTGPESSRWVRLWVSGKVYEPLRNSNKAMRAVA